MVHSCYPPWSLCGMIKPSNFVSQCLNKWFIINVDLWTKYPGTKFSTLGIEQESDDEYAFSPLPLSTIPPSPTAYKANISHPLLEIILADTELGTLFQEKQNETEVEEETPIPTILTPTRAIQILAPWLKEHYTCIMAIPFGKKKPTTLKKPWIGSRALEPSIFYKRALEVHKETSKPHHQLNLQ